MYISTLLLFSDTPKGALDPMLVSDDVGFGNWTQDIRKNSQCLTKLSHLSGPPGGSLLSFFPLRWCRIWSCLAPGSAWDPVWILSYLNTAMFSLSLLHSRSQVSKVTYRKATLGRSEDSFCYIHNHTVSLSMWFFFTPGPPVSSTMPLYIVGNH